MADDIDKLLSAQAGGDDVDALLSARAGGSDVVPRETSQSAAKPLPWYQRAAQGLRDPVVGIGQLEQHLMPDKWANFLRQHPGLPIVGPAGLALSAASGFQNDVSTSEVDQGIAQGEARYQAGRKAAGSTGIDWWRIGGNAANPLNYAGGAGGATSAARISGAAFQGALTALMQPVTRPGSFAQQKVTQGAIGGVVGGTIGTAVEALQRPLSAAANWIRGQFSGPQAQTAAQQATHDILTQAGIDPSKVDPRVMSSIQQDVYEASQMGVATDPKVIANRADAASLPVPIDLTRGQAARDPLQFAWEQNHRSLAPAITDLLATQNRQLIENMNQLGAKDALGTYQTSENLITSLNKMDGELKSQIDAAYANVRNQAGRPAMMDHVGFVKSANDALDQEQLGAFLPPTLRKQLNDIAEGKLPLNVNVAQQLDKVWGAEQRAAEGSSKAAIGELRSALNKADVSDALGQQAMQAYGVAKNMARQRFALIDSVPAYKAAIEGEPADNFFQKYIMNAPARSIDGLNKILERADPTAKSQMQSTVVGMLKDKALSGAADENGVFSQAAFNKLLNDPVKRAKFEAIFHDAPEVLDQLDRVGRVSSNVLAFPKASAVNTSNTAAALRTMQAESEPGIAKKAVEALLPHGVKVVKEVMKGKAQQKAIEQALTPGVTTEAIPAVSPAAQKAGSTMSRLLIPPAVSGTSQATQ